MSETKIISTATPQSSGRSSPALFADQRRALMLMGTLTLLFALSPFLPDTHLLEAPRYYLPLHATMEFFAIAVSVLVFAVAWHTPSSSQSCSMTLLACAFLAVALIDFLHVMTFEGMPAFLTEPSPGMTVSFWLAARFVAALALLAVALLPWRENVSGRVRLGLLTGALALAAFVAWVGLFRANWLPLLFVAGQGLTAWKIGAEYLLFALHGVAFLLLWRRARQGAAVNFTWLAAAAWVMGLSELYFTLYTRLTDTYHLFGHVYKMIAYAIVYRAVVLAGFRLPFAQLDQARGQAAESEARYANIIASAMDGVVVCDSDQRIVLYNDAAGRIFGHPAADIIGKKLDSLLPAGSEARHAEHIARFSSSSVTHRRLGQINRVQGRRADGSIFPAEISISKSIHDGESYFTAIVRDNSSQAQQELTRQQLQEELQRRVAEQTAQLSTTVTRLQILEKAVDSSLNAIAMAGMDGRLNYVNVAFLRLWGQNGPDAVLGRLATEFWGNPADAEAVINAMARDGSWEGTLKGRHADGRLMDIQVSAHLVNDAHGQPTAMMASFIDITERNRAIESLKESEALLRATFEQAAVGIAHVGPDGRWLRVNDQLCRMLGYTRAELLTRGYQEVTPPEDRARDAQLLGEMLSGQTDTVQIEKRYLRSDGLIIWVHINGTAVRDETGQIRYIIAIIQDINERRRAQEAMNRSERKYRELYESLHDAFAAVDMNGRITEFNSAYLSLVGYNAEEIGALTYVDLTPERWHAPELRIVNEQVLRNGFSEVYEKEYRRKDGTIVPIELRAFLLRDDAGAPRGMWALVRDISERKHSDALVRESVARLNDAQRLAKVGSWELDLVTNQLIWSDEIFRMFEVDQTRFGASYEAFLNAIHPDDRDMVNKAYTDSLVNRTPYEIVHRLRMADGRIKHVRETCESFFGADGKPVRSVGTVQDISELYKAEMELRQHREHLEDLVRQRTAALATAKDDAERANRAKSDFLSRMSHELRTPMNAILGFAQVLELEKITPEQKDFVHEIHRAGDHLLELINELLDLSRIEAGKIATVLQPVPVKSVIADAIQITQPLLTEKHVVLFNKCADDTPVLADPTRLRQILVNLLSNAAKYNRDGGRVLIGSQQRRDGVLRLSVTDNGPGIPTEKLGSLFRPFERLGAEFSDIQGTGIGLALSKQLAELMGGTLGVDSTPGEGSTFWADLPIVMEPEQAAPSAPHNPAAAPSDIRRLKVLYVEDNPANLKVVEAMFRHHPNLRLMSATNGEYGLELAKRYAPDAILLDIHLPGMDGYAVLDALKTDSDTHGIPVIALSADAMPIDIEHGLEAGFRDYLTKPVKVEALMGALERILGHATTAHPPGTRSPLTE